MLIRQENTPMQYIAGQAGGRGEAQRIFVCRLLLPADKFLDHG
jgi:hypothetical protein